MINLNGKIISGSEATLNRGFLYGDGVFETIRVAGGTIFFLEDHYFRLMSAMRICRMEIPMNFTMEFLESEILSLVAQSGLTNARVRLTVFRSGGGFYKPVSDEVQYVISCAALSGSKYELFQGECEIDLYKDFYLSAHLLSTIKTTARMINITGSIYASENGLDDCFLINERKNIVEALAGNVFVVTSDKIVTPPLSEGCINGIMRKQVMTVSAKAGLQVFQEPVSAFDLQKADEIFITNVIKGVTPVTKYRRKEFGRKTADQVVGWINALIQ